jgi:hypothetical protein
MDCRREGCVCTSEVGIEREGARYCSVYCAEGGAQESDRQAACACGHAGCTSEIAGTAIPQDVSLL